MAGIVIFSNSDKDFHEEWKEGDDLLNFPKPFRALITGAANSGKTCLVKNLVMKQQPDFEEVYIISADPEADEYSDLFGHNVFVLDELPDGDSFDKEISKLLIVEDIVLNELSKKGRERLSRLMRHTSTHRNLSIIITAHDYFTVPLIVRGMSNLNVLFRLKDKRRIPTVAKAVMVDNLGELQAGYGQFDSLWIDETGGPWLRKNGYEIIKQ